MNCIGIDGCKSGWFFVLFSANGDWDINIYSSVSSFAKFLEKGDLILIDIPIGLPFVDKRQCDITARRLLSLRRGSSVFPAPSRKAAYEKNYKKACIMNKKALGVNLSRQTWNICKRIIEVDRFILHRDQFPINLREAHPEICFWALAGGQAMKFSKKTKQGVEERLNLLKSVVPQSLPIYEKARALFMRKDVGHDDILDALALAVTGFLGRNLIASIPDQPEFDALGVRMEIIYSKKFFSNSALSG